MLRCTIAQNFYAIGYNGCELAKTVLDGGTIDYNNDSGTITIYPEDYEAHLEVLKERGLA